MIIGGSMSLVRDGDLPIVVGVNGSEGSITAVRWAARHANETGAPVRLVHAVTDVVGRAEPAPIIDVGGADPNRPVRNADRILGAAAAEVVRQRPMVAVSACAAPDTPAEALIDDSSEAYLLVVGSTGRGRWATLFSSVATRVVAAAHCPVIVVRGDAKASGPVVVAVDGSGRCGPALRFAFLEAARRRCALVAVHAWQTPPLSARVALRAGTAVATELTQEDVIVSAWRSLTDAIDRYRRTFPDVLVHERLVEGDPETVMTGQTWGAGLVVVGSRGGGPLSGLLLGSTSQHLMHTADCPVAVVREDNGVPADTPAPVTGPGGRAATG